MRAFAVAAFFAIVPASAQEAPRNGTIVLYRGATLVGAVIACPIRYQGREIVELGRGKYAEWTVKPGRYLLTNKTTTIEVSVEPGETRYVRCAITPGVLVNRTTFQMSDKATFEEEAAKLSSKNIDPVR